MPSSGFTVGIHCMAAAAVAAAAPSRRYSSFHAAPPFQGRPGASVAA